MADAVGGFQRLSLAGSMKKHERTLRRSLTVRSKSGRPFSDGQRYFFTTQQRDELGDDVTRGLGEIRLMHPPGTTPITPASMISIEAIGGHRTPARGNRHRLGQRRGMPVHHRRADTLC